MFVVGMNINMILDSRETKMTKHMQKQKQKKKKGFVYNSETRDMNRIEEWN